MNNEGQTRKSRRHLAFEDFLFKPNDGNRMSFNLLVWMELEWKYFVVKRGRKVFWFDGDNNS